MHSECLYTKFTIDGRLGRHPIGPEMLEKNGLLGGFLCFFCAIGSINSHYFHIIGDKLINPIGVYIPIIRIPTKGWMSLSPIQGV